MTRYFIDTSDGHKAFVDDEGMEFADDVAARAAALAGLPDMARDYMQNGDDQRFMVRLRNESEQVVYCCTLTLVGGWCAPGSDPLAEEFE